MVKNIGIGADIEDIDRFKETDNAFLKKVFTESELEYCFSKVNPPQHLAARFAGKEAAIKALSSLGEKVIDPKTIEILNDGSGAPFISMRADIRVSLSHCKDKAIAFALVIKD